MPCRMELTSTTRTSFLQPSHLLVEQPVILIVQYVQQLPSICVLKDKLKVDKIRLIELFGTSKSEFSTVSTSMSDLCFDVFGISKEKKDPKLVNGYREFLDALPSKQRCDDECDSSFDHSSLNEEISEKQQERRAQNKYPHQIYHKGYAHFAEEIINNF